MIRDFSVNDAFFILHGLQWTIALAVVSISISLALGLFLAVLRGSGSAFIRWLTLGYVTFFLNTPLLMQLFVAYFGMALLGFDTSAWWSAVVGLCLHGSAYYAEIWRGGIAAISKGQREAAHSLGISRLPTFVVIILPQAFRICLPALVGFSVQLIKGTSLTAIIGFIELTRSAQIVNGAVYQPVLIYGVIGAIYFMLCYPISYWASGLEHSLAANNKRGIK